MSRVPPPVCVSCHTPLGAIWDAFHAAKAKYDKDPTYNGEKVHADMKLLIPSNEDLNELFNTFNLESYCCRKMISTIRTPDEIVINN